MLIYPVPPRSNTGRVQLFAEQASSSAAGIAMPYWTSSPRRTRPSERLSSIARLPLDEGITAPIRPSSAARQDSPPPPGTQRRGSAAPDLSAPAVGASKTPPGSRSLENGWSPFMMVVSQPGMRWRQRAFLPACRNSRVACSRNRTCASICDAAADIAKLAKQSP